MTKKKGSKFPSVLYVAYEEELDGERYLICQADPGDLAEMNDKREVAVYQLHRVVTVSNKTFVV